MTRYIWIAFSLALIVGLATMAWISALVVQLDEAEWRTRMQMQSEEDIRLALWHLDSALVPLIARENARPHFYYKPFYRDELESLAQNSPHVLLYFEIAPDNSIVSPQVPEIAKNRQAMAKNQQPLALTIAQQRLSALCDLLDRDALLDSLPRENDSQRLLPLSRPKIPQKQAEPVQSNHQYRSKYPLGKEDWELRNSSIQMNVQMAAEQKAMAFPHLDKPKDIAEGTIRALWVDDMLILARRISVDDEIFIQGCWLDWRSIRSWLLSLLAELPSVVDLQPAQAGEKDKTRMLATLPVSIVCKTPAFVKQGGSLPIRLSLLLAWGCLLLAAIAIIVLLAGVVSLSERRAAFVSAVTHELRTPLTTFRMYSEMLQRGMVKKEKRQRYLDTLCAESERLGHLIENVLAYARIENRKVQSRSEQVTLQQLWQKVEERLHRRAAEANMELITSFAEVASTRLQTDVSAIDQILFNLVDNACKYGFSNSNRRIEITATMASKRLLLSVRDYGPGIASKESRRLFLPFHKSARDAASSAPGVGLGLALSRRLARQLGGELYLRKDVSPGACFCLSLSVC